MPKVFQTNTVFSSGTNCSANTDMGIDALIVGFVYGLQFNEVTVGPCYQTMESLAALINDMLYSAQYLYDPTTWGPALAAAKNVVDLDASVYAYCGLEILYNSIAEFFSDEGFAQLVGRSFTGIIFEFPQDWVYVSDSSYSDFCRAYHLAKIFSVIFNFQVTTS